MDQTKTTTYTTGIDSGAYYVAVTFMTEDGGETVPTPFVQLAEEARTALAVNLGIDPSPLQRRLYANGRLVGHIPADN